MNAANTEDLGSEQQIATDANLDSALAAAPSLAASGKALFVGIIVAVAGAWLAANLADRFRISETVEEGVKFRNTKLEIGRASQNAAVAYALLGAILSLILGVTAASRLGRFSIPLALAAGLAGMVLGACLGAASSSALTPFYLHRMGTADVTLTLLVHLGIWTAVGAASGVAFGVGSGSRDALVRSVVGGIAGAALGTLLFDVFGAFLPLARTERPLSEEAGTRLAANIVLSLCVAIGIVVVASQKTRVTATKA